MLFVEERAAKQFQTLGDIFTQHFNGNWFKKKSYRLILKCFNFLAQSLFNIIGEIDHSLQYNFATDDWSILPAPMPVDRYRDPMYFSGVLKEYILTLNYILQPN
jgi:hypothetical protein